MTREIKIDLSCEPDVMQLTASNPETREIVIAYIRDNSTTITKELDGDVLKWATFGTGAMQVFREMYLAAEPIDQLKMLEKLQKGMPCNSDSTL